MSSLLDAVNVSNDKSVSIRYPIPIDEEHFPDENFRKYLMSADFYSGAGRNGILSEEDALTVILIAVDNLFIRDLTGIEYFPNLIKLYCYGNKLTSLDVSKNLKLQNLGCQQNELKTLDISHNLELVKLWCYDNMITSLNISNNATLKRLHCDKGVIIKGSKDDIKITREPR